VKMEIQEETNWCWAAVAVSVHNFLNSGNGNWTQGQLATPVLQTENQIPAGVDCSQTPALCDLTAALDDALTITGNLRPGGCLQNQHLVFNSIKNWVAAKLPVGARIVWWQGGAHFIVLDGYRELMSGAQQVHVQDPLYGPSFQNYDDLVADYPPGGNWQDTYLVKKNGGPTPPPNGGS
jgi:Papain-like cysteine protease AvrRpt2